ncbi:MAG: histone deacetylase family protein [Betaproteobacteria bacterium]
MATGYISHPDFSKHEMGSYHPESPERLDAIDDQLILSRIDDFLTHIEAPLATESQIQLVHDQALIQYLKEHSPQAGYFEIDGDTSMNPHTYQAALRAAGACIAAVDAIMQGHVNNAFCAVRPPGHHAEPSQAKGFCFFNNIAIAAKYALEHYGLQKVAIIDFDVHHGNGTEAAFNQDARVLMCSFFQHPFYPFSGDHPTSDNMVNIPVPAFTKGADIRAVVSDIWMPRLEAFAPEFVFISAGFDAHREDDLGQLSLVEADYAWITQQIQKMAKQYAHGRILSTLEGGYHLSALGRSVVAHIKELAEI